MSVSAAAGHAALFDFESQSSGAFPSVVSTVDGITLTAISTTFGAFVRTDNPPFALPSGMGNRALIGSLTPTLTSDQFTSIRMDFSVALSSLSLIVGDGGGDNDGTVRIRAFDSSNAQIGSDSTLLAVSAGTPTLSVSALGISYVLVDSFGGPDNINSVFWDNVTVQAVPEPGMASLMALAGVLTFFRRRN